VVFAQWRAQSTVDALPPRLARERARLLVGTCAQKVSEALCPGRPSGGQKVSRIVSVLALALLVLQPAAAFASGPASGGEQPHPGIELVSKGGFQMQVFGYLRTKASFIEDDTTRTDFVGLNDGFTLANARLGFKGEMDDLSFVLQLDAAVDRRDHRNSSTGEVKAEAKDAYVDYGLFPQLHVRVGQFKPPFDAEEIISTKDLLFTERAVGSRGVKGVEGFNEEGLSIDRQPGLMLYSEPIEIPGVPLSLAYYLAVTNGSAANQPLNDNDSFAYFGRLEIDVAEIVRIGGAGYWNEVTTGEAPDLLTEEHFGMTADLLVDLYGVLLGGELIQRSSSFPDVPAEPKRKATGYHASIGYRLPFGIIPAYRFAFYDPTADFEAEDPVAKNQLAIDEVTLHSIALSWLSPWHPLKVQCQYTIAQEDEARSIDNNRFDAIVQVVF
jgi:hypothetical protein